MYVLPSSPLGVVDVPGKVAGDGVVPLIVPFLGRGVSSIPMSCNDDVNSRRE